MASRKITFSFPEEVAVRFMRSVPSSRRSSYVVELIEARMRERDRMLAKACEAANNDQETRQIEREMDVLPNTMTDEWKGGSASTPR